MFLCKIMSITEAIYYLEQIFSKTNIFFCIYSCRLKSLSCFNVSCCCLYLHFGLWWIKGRGEGNSSSSKHHISSLLAGPPMRAGSLGEWEAGDKNGGRLGWNVKKGRKREKRNGDITTSSPGLFP